MPLITTTFCFYSVESFIAGVRKHRKTFQRLLFCQASSVNIIKYYKVLSKGESQINPNNKQKATPKYRQTQYHMNSLSGIPTELYIKLRLLSRPHKYH